MANRTTDPGSESEWLTRKRRVDPLLDAAGWPRRKGKASPAFRTEEEETAHGPADYALWLDDRVVGIVEAKKLTNQCNTILAPQCFDETGLNFLKNYMGEDQASEISNMRPRQAVAVGRASSSARPVMFEIRDLGQRWAHPVAHPAPAP